MPLGGMKHHQNGHLRGASRMRAVRNTDEGVMVVDVDEPSGPGVRLDIASSSICGTDLNFVAMGAQGFTYGHEFAGVAPDGRAYAVEPALRCGVCGECASGHPIRCTGSERANLGLYADGGLADAIVVPEYTLVPLPDGLDVRDASLVEPGSVAWHGMRRAKVQPGERIVVVGGGSIGLLAVAAARRMGFAVDLEARHPHQLDAAERLGAGRPSGTYEVVIDAAGSASGLARAAELATTDARVVLLGVYHDTIPFPGLPALMKELSIVNAMAYGFHDGRREFDEVAAMLAAEPDIAKTVITHRFPLDDVAEAFRVAGDRAAGAIKVVLHP
jgi:2-desacetyl-2-hydroxyethyl bacteriochlorophyllide A dehydrogenase